MSRKELYQAAKGAFIFVYLYLIMALLVALLMIAAGPEGRELAVLLVFLVVSAVVGLLAKRTLICDLWEGRTETLFGRVIRRELGDSLRFMRVEYLLLDTEAAVQKLVFVRESVPGLLDGKLVLHYLPRSKVIVQMEQVKVANVPRHRSKEWYKEKPQRERELAESARLEPCKLYEDYWFWERLPVVGVLLLFVLYKAIKNLC